MYNVLKMIIITLLLASDSASCCNVRRQFSKAANCNTVLQFLVGEKKKKHTHTHTHTKRTSPAALSLSPPSSLVRAIQSPSRPTA